MSRAAKDNLCKIYHLLASLDPLWPKVVI